MFLDFNQFEQLVSIAAEIQTDLMQSEPTEWTGDLEAKFEDEVGTLATSRVPFQEIYEAILQTAINFGMNFHLAWNGQKSVADFVLMFKAASTYQGWAKFYGDADEPNSIEGVLVNKPDPDRQTPLMMEPDLARNMDRRGIDTLCDLFRFKRGFHSLRENPANPVTWSPNRESWQDEYPMFYHTPDLHLPTGDSGVLFLTLDMDVFNVPKTKIGTDEDPMMRSVLKWFLVELNK